MEFASTLTAYLNLRQRLARKDITGPEFERQVADLAFTLADGSRWRIAADGMGWQTWTGADWALARPPSAAVGLPGRPGVTELSDFRAPLHPASLGNLVVDVTRSALSGLRGAQFLSFLGIAGVVWLLNAYLMTIGDPGGLLGAVRTVFSGSDNLVAKIVLWLVLGAAGTSIWLRIRREGSAAFQRDLAQVPRLVRVASGSGGASGVAWLVGAAGFMVLVLDLVYGRLLALALAVWIYTILPAGNRSLLFLAVWLAWQDIARGKTGTLGRPPEPNCVFMGMVGMALGAGVAVLVPGQTWTGFLLGITLLGLSLVVCLGSGAKFSPPKRVGRRGGESR